MKPRMCVSQDAYPAGAASDIEKAYLPEVLPGSQANARAYNQLQGYKRRG